MGVLKRTQKKLRRKENLFYTLNINARLQPFDRADIYEDRIDDEIISAGIGEINGGGSQQNSEGEIVGCDVDIILNSEDMDTLNQLVEILSKFDFPKGTVLCADDSDMVFQIGTLEGMAVYLNGTDLPKSVYRDCDVNYVIEKMKTKMSGLGTMYSYFEGNRETALYFYGSSFEDMKRSIEGFAAKYPLCHKCRIEKIA